MKQLALHQRAAGEYAGIVSRFAAYALDVVVISISILFTTEIISLSGAFFFVQPEDPQYIVIQITRNLIQGIVPLAYFILFWMLGGQTLGMSVIGIRIIRLNGRRITFWVALIRLIGYGLSLFLFLGFLMILVDDKRQGLHDKLAGTVVIYAGNYQLHRHLMAQLNNRLDRQ